MKMITFQKSELFGTERHWTDEGFMRAKTEGYPFCFHPYTPGFVNDGDYWDDGEPFTLFKDNKDFYKIPDLPKDEKTRIKIDFWGKKSEGGTRHTVMHFTEDGKFWVVGTVFEYDV